MANTLVIGSGAYGCRCAKRCAELFSQSVLLMDKREFDSTEFSLFVDCLELSESMDVNEIRLKSILSEHSNILLVSSLGGDSFSESHGLISKCARQLKIPLVTLCAVPFIFESERRLRALEMLSVIPESVSNLFVLDLQKTISEDCNPVEFLENTLDFLSSVLSTLSRLLETSPFFSLCSDPLYTLSIGSGVTFSDSVLDALQHPYFNLDKNKGKVLICTEAHPSTFEIEQSLSLLTSRFGMLPEMINHSGLGDERVLLFIPISYLCG